MYKFKNTCGALILVVLWSIAGNALGESQEKRIEKARRLMEQGQEAFLQKRFEAAAAHFDEAFNASPFAAFLYNAGLASERAGNKKGAIGFYQRYIELEPEASDAEKIQEKIDALLAAEETPAKEGEGETDTVVAVPESAGEMEITETDMKSLISVRTNPKDATIRIISQAGEEISTSSGPLAQTVAGGTYTIEASHPDYRTVTTDIFVAPGQVYVVVVEMSQGAFLGFLRVITNPPGAAIFIDDKGLGQAGVAPFRNVLPAGHHRIWIENPGYVPRQEEVQIDISEEVELNVTLERPTFGALLVKTNADNAVVHIDGVPSGKADSGKPFRKQLPNGKHRVLVTREGLKDYLAEVEIRGGQETKLLVRLNSKPSRTSGWVSAGFSAALFATGTVFGVFALKIKKDLESDRDAGRLASDDDRILQGFLWGIGADMSFGVGTIIAGMSLYYFLRDPLPPSEGKTQKPVDYPIDSDVATTGTPTESKPVSPQTKPDLDTQARQKRPAFLLAPLFGKNTVGLGLAISF